MQILQKGEKVEENSLKVQTKIQNLLFGKSVKKS